MDLIQKILASAYLSGFAYIIGMILVHPASPYFLYLAKKYDYDAILNKANKICILLWIVCGVVVFLLLP